MMSGFSDVSMTSRNNCFYFWRPQDTSNNPRTNPKSFLENIIRGNLRISVNSFFDNYGKETGTENHDDPSNYFPRKHVQLWNCETKQPRNKKTRNETPRPPPKQQKNTKQRNLPPTPPQHTDSHPCTRPPSWVTRGNMGDTNVSAIYWPFAKL